MAILGMVLHFPPKAYCAADDENTQEHLKSITFRRPTWSSFGNFAGQHFETTCHRQVFSQCAGTCAEAAIDAQAFSSDSVSSDSELAPSSSRNPSIAKNSSSVGAKLDAANDTFFSDGVADMERVDHIEVVCTLLMLDASDNVECRCL